MPRLQQARPAADNTATPDTVDTDFMNGGKIMVWAAAALCGLALILPVARAETLNTAVSSALNQYPDIKAALAERAAAAEEVTISKAQRLPRVDLSVKDSLYSSGAGHDEATTLSLSASQSVYDGGTKRADRARRNAELSAQDQRLADTAGEIALQTVLAYLDVLQARENLAAIRSNIGTLTAIAKRVKLRIAAGFGAETDRLDVELKLETARLSLLDAEQQAANAEVSFTTLTGLSADDLARPALPRAALPVDATAAVALAKQGSPRLIALIYDARAADAVAKGTEAARRPKLDLDLAANKSFDWSNSNGNEDLTARLVFSVNLFDGGSARARARQARQSANASRYRAATAALALEQKIRLSWNDMQSNRRKLDVIASQQKLARRNLALYLSRFEAGVEPLQRLLDVQSQASATDVQRIATNYSILATGFRILAATGRLLPALGLSLPTGPARNG